MGLGKSIITLTAMEGAREMALSAGADDFLAKPIKASQLFATLVAVVSRAVTGGALMGAVMFAGRAIAPLTSVVMLATVAALVVPYLYSELRSKPHDR